MVKGARFFSFGFYERTSERPLDKELVGIDLEPHTDFGWMYFQMNDLRKFYLNKFPSRPFIWAEYSHAMGNSNGNLKTCGIWYMQKDKCKVVYMDFVDQGLAPRIQRW